MAPLYSVDLQWRIVWLCLFHHKSKHEIATLLHVSTRTVERYIQLFLSTGDVAQKPKKNGPDSLLSQYDKIIELLSKQPSLYLHELRYKLSSLQELEWIVQLFVGV